jgi:hypothetical protein
MLNQNPEDQRPNSLVIFGFYNNAMPGNVNYSIGSSQINDLDGAIQK